MKLHQLIAQQRNTFLPAALVVHHLLLFTSYGFYRLLPIVHMGERSWPLYFFVLDGLTLVLVLVAIAQFFRSKVKEPLYWFLIILLFLFPLINVWATFSDLHRKLCGDPQCTSFIPGPDVSKMELKWEE